MKHRSSKEAIKTDKPQDLTTDEARTRKSEVTQKVKSDKIQELKTKKTQEIETTGTLEIISEESQKAGNDYTGHEIRTSASRSASMSDTPKEMKWIALRAPSICVRSPSLASSITSTTPPAIGVGRPNSGATGPEVAVDAASLEAAAGAAAVSTAAHRLSMISSTSPRTSWVGPPSTGQDDQQNIRYWLRDLGRAVREMSQYIGGELRTLSDHMEVMEERLAAMERSQQRTNESLRQLVGRRSETPH